MSFSRVDQLQCNFGESQFLNGRLTGKLAIPGYE